MKFCCCTQNARVAMDTVATDFSSPFQQEAAPAGAAGSIVMGMDTMRCIVSISFILFFLQLTSMEGLHGEILIFLLLLYHFIPPKGEPVPL